jgi:hypothetical protein
MLKQIAAAPLPIKLVVASFLCPTELSLFVAGLRLPPHRVALIALLPLAIHRLLLARKARAGAFDVLVLLYNAWTLAAYASHGDGTEGLVYGGSLVVESLGAYLVARAYVRDIDQFLATLKLLVLSALVAGLIALPDMVLGEYFTHNRLRALVGGEPLPPVEYRLGLARAASVFDHPIHLGTYCASLVAMIWSVERPLGRRVRYALIAAGATLTALSSAPLLCVGLQILLLLWERATRGHANRVPMLIVMLAGLYIGAALVMTRSPVAFIATGMTLDSWTGFYRMLIWEYGIQNVLDNPLLGIGLADWERPKWMVSSTIDAFWLVTAMRAGVPALGLLLAAIVLLAMRVERGMRLSRSKAILQAGRGWMIALVALSLAASTVHFWNVLYAYFFFFLALAGWIADPRRGAVRRVQPGEARASAAGLGMAGAAMPARY